MASNCLAARDNRNATHRRHWIFATGLYRLLEGRSQYQAPEVDGTVYINEGNAVSGSFHQVEITDAYEYDLIGKII